VGSNYLIGGKEAKRMGTSHANIVPYEAFMAKDQYIVVGALNDHQFERLCNAINRSDLILDLRFKSNSDRVTNREVLVPILQQEFVKKVAKEWIHILDVAQVPCGPINNMQQVVFPSIWLNLKVFSDPQVLHRDMLVQVEHPTAGPIKMAGIPVKYSETKPSIRLPPPVLGQHTQEVLSELLGYNSLKLDQLEKQGVIAMRKV
jgi:succinate--hydroxymethylglutarate CoA-transferase